MKFIFILLLTVIAASTEAQESPHCFLRQNTGLPATWTRNINTDDESITIYFLPGAITERIASLMELRTIDFRDVFAISTCSTTHLTCDSRPGFGITASIQRVSDNEYDLTLFIRRGIPETFRTGTITWRSNNQFDFCAYNVYHFTETPKCEDIRLTDPDDQGSKSIFWRCRMQNVSPPPSCSIDYRTDVEDDFVEIIPPRMAKLNTTRPVSYDCTLNLNQKLNRLSPKPHQFRINFSVHFPEGDPPNNTKSVISAFISPEFPPIVTSFQANSLSGNLKMVKPRGIVMFECDARGNPRPKLHFLKTSSHEKILAIETTPSTSSFTTIATFFTKPVDCMDFGDYICVATNEMGTEKSSVIPIKILCPPEITSSYSKYAYATVQNNAIIYIDVITYPYQLTFTLKRLDPSGGSLDVTRVPEYNASVIINQHPKCTVILELLRLELYNSGLYELTVQNEAGLVVYRFNLDVVDKINNQCVVIDWNHMAVVVGAVAGIAFVIGLIIGVHVYKVITCLCGRSRRHASKDDQDLNIVSMRQKKEAAIHSASWTKDATLPMAPPLRLNIEETKSSPVIPTTPAVDDDGYLTPSPSPRLSKRALPELPGTARKPGSPDSQSSVATDKDGYLVVLTKCDQNRQNKSSSSPTSDDGNKRQSLDSQRTLHYDDKGEENGDQPPENIYHCLSPTPHNYTYVTTPGQGKDAFTFTTKEPIYSTQDNIADEIDSLRESTPLV